MNATPRRRMLAATFAIAAASTAVVVAAAATPTSRLVTAAQSGIRGVALPLPYATGTATQVITVATSSSRSTVATLQAWDRAPGGGWLQHGAAITAHVGSGGVGVTREWRQVTPAGSFTLTQAFGDYGNPGTRLSYFTSGRADWWVSQYGPLYNTHQRCSARCGFTLGGPNTHLAFVRPYYNYGVVIDYNTRNSPTGVRQGYGSAFFLHVTDGLPTAGCVAISQRSLVALLRWLTPTAHPRILIGVGPASHNPKLWVTAARSTGSSVLIHGYASDPDANPVTVRVYEGSRFIKATRTNASTKAFTIAFYASNARHVYTVFAINTGKGTGNANRTYAVTVNGAPFGTFDGARVNADGSVTLSGWAVDRDSTSRSIHVAVYDGGTLVGTFAADGVRADVDRILGITGNHGFVITLPSQTPGEHSYRVYAVNYGYAGPDVALARSPRLVTVP